MALPNDLRGEVLQEAKKKYEEENSLLIANSRVIKKALYKNLREKIEMSYFFPTENGKYIDNFIIPVYKLILSIFIELAHEQVEQEIENLTKLIETLEETDKQQLYVLMSKSFRDRLPEDLKKTITNTLPSRNIALLYAIDNKFDTESNFSNEDYYAQHTEGEIPENSKLMKSKT